MNHPSSEPKLSLKSLKSISLSGSQAGTPGLFMGEMVSVRDSDSSKPKTCSIITALGELGPVNKLTASSNVTLYNSWSFTVPSWNRLLRCSEKGSQGVPMIAKSICLGLRQQRAVGCNIHGFSAFCSANVECKCWGVWFAKRNSLKALSGSLAPIRS